MQRPSNKFSETQIFSKCTHNEPSGPKLGFFKSIVKGNLTFVVSNVTLYRLIIVATVNFVTICANLRKFRD